MNVFEFVNISSQIVPDREALVYEEARYTYDSLRQSIVGLASRLHSAGVGPGHRLAVMDTNSDLYVQLFYATAFLGGTFVPLNYRAKTDELEYFLNAAQVGTLCAGGQYLDIALAARDGAPSLERVLSLGARADGAPAISELPLGSPELDPADVEDEALCVVMFTSGTTSKPKGVMLRYDDFSNYVMGTAEPAYEDDRFAQLLVAPFYHIAGLSALMLSAYSARRMVVLSQFEPLRWLQSVQDERVTHAFLVPTMLKRVVDERAFSSFNLSSLEVLSYGAAATPPGVLLRALELFPPSVGFVNAYGQTETTATVAMLGPDDHRFVGSPEEIERKKARLRSIGKPLPDVEIMIVDQDRRGLPPGEIGEVAIRTVRSMKGYLPEPGKEIVSRQPDGWIYTSDLGWMDEDGYVFLAGRKSDMIIRGGENISPEEVEAVLYRHPVVEDVAVVGIPDEEWGERVVAVVVLREGARQEVGAEDIIGFCRERLASYKKPSQVEFVSELPRSPLGKVLKTSLRDQLKTAPIGAK